jgi:hypothetical protein
MNEYLKIINSTYWLESLAIKGRMQRELKFEEDDKAKGKFLNKEDLKIIIVVEERNSREKLKSEV